MDHDDSGEGYFERRAVLTETGNDARGGRRG